MSHNIGNYRVPVFTEPRLISGSNIMQTPFGNVRTSQMVSSGPPPPLPPSPLVSQQSGYGYNPMNSYGSYTPQYLSGGGFGGGGYGGSFGGFGTGFGSYGGYGSYNRFGGGQFSNPMDPETRFIQIAEESSRPAFQSIECLVGAIGNIAAMLDSTFFALTSSFRAILGVAANFGRLRGVFAQFWTTFALFRGIAWVYRKLLYLMRLSNVDPSSLAFKEAFAAASSSHGGVPGQFDTSNQKKQSPWPVVAFLGFIFTAPYLIMKLLGSLTNSAVEESRNPRTWVQPITSQALYDFQARNPQEISVRAGQTVLVAPKEVQNTHKLMNSGWALASTDGQTSGLLPISYVQRQNLIKREPTLNVDSNEHTTIIPEAKDFDEHMPVIPEVDEKLNVDSPNV